MYYTTSNPSFLLYKGILGVTSSRGAFIAQEKESKPILPSPACCVLKKTRMIWLSKWLSFIAVLAVFNTLQSYYDNIFVNAWLYSLQPEQMTQLGSRLFACWTLLSAFILAMTSYQIHILHLTRTTLIDNRVKEIPYTTSAAVSYWYDLTLSGWFITFAHFFSEIYFFKTASWNITTFLPIFFSSVSFCWMLMARSFYLYDDSDIKAHRF